MLCPYFMDMHEFFESRRGEDGKVKILEDDDVEALLIRLDMCELSVYDHLRQNIDREIKKKETKQAIKRVA